MTKYTLILYSKNKTSIKKFLEFINNISKTQNFQILKKLLKKKKTRKKISVLKSPHVNKTAQEQFEYIYYSIKIYFYSWEIKKYFIMLKKIKNQLFPDIYINIKTKIYASKKNKLINLEKISLYKPTININNKNQFNKTLLYLKILDCYGEI
uniref:Ribosomal protein S10 n=1 Tax=Navicula veneta TaxID=138539 RepID=A0A8F0WGJ4_9STRA|nr:ribosomal protein S10 [Navicula veneta]QWM93633.1 ribosomal protein S10 [Navicula veneta]